MNNRVLLLTLLLFTGGFSGCVTTVDGAREVNIDEAVENRVAAGLEYLQLGQPSEARQHLSRAIDLDNRSAAAHNAMALLYRYERDPEREERHYRLALKADRDYAPAQNNLGTLLFNQDKYREALQQFERAAENPRNPSRGIALENVGRTYLALEMREEAMQAFNRAVRVNPQALVSLIELSKMYFDDDNLRAANGYYIEYLERAGQQSPSSLWLGIRIAAAMDDEDRVASYEMLLRQKFADTAEYRAWRAWRDKRREGRS